MSGWPKTTAGGAASLVSPAFTGTPTAPSVTDAATRGQIATILDTPQWTNVAAFGATGNGVTDDSTAIQAAINACPVGGIVYFPNPATTYAIGSTLVLPAGGNITLLGSGGRLKDGGPTGQVITMLAGANLDACIAEYWWWNNSSSTISAGIQLRDLTINANTTNQTGGLGHCFAGKMWRSQIAYCGLLNARGSGINISLTTRNGATVDSTNHCIENYITDNSLTGFVVAGVTLNGANVTDTFIVDNVFDGGAAGTANGIQGINNAGAGCYISGNHIYVCANGITFGNVSLFRVLGNYIEQSSAPAASGTVYQIAFAPTGPNCVCNNNVVKLATATAAGTTFRGIGIPNVVGAATESAITICGNVVNGGSSASDSLLYVNPNTQAGILTIAGNSLQATNGAVPFVNNFPALLSTEAGVSFTVGTVTTATAGFDRMPTCAGAPTGVPADLTQGIPMIYDTTNHQLWIYDGAWSSNPIDGSVFHTSATIQTALGNLVLGTAYQNTLGYDVWHTVYLAVTVNTSLVLKDGVGPTNTPTQTTIITGTVATGIIPVRAKIPHGYYRLLSSSGTVTDAIVGQYLEAA